MDSDDDRDDLAAGEPPVIDPYAVLGLDDRAATADQVRSAYRKAALRWHPDKAGADKKDEAHGRFQEVAFAYAVLSDPARRRRYDATGSTAESVADADGFSWSDFYRAAFADAVSAGAIETFAAQYRRSDEERADVLAAYARHRGGMDGVYESVMLSDVLADDARFRAIIDEAIAAGDAKAFAKYTGETAASKRARVAAAKSESREAEEYAKELGVHDKLFGKDKDKGASSADKGNKAAKKARGKAKEDDQAGLAALIQKRQQDRSASFLDNLAAKYGATEPKKKSKGGKKRRAGEEAEEEEVEEEPSEEAFQAAAARLKNGSSSGKSAKSAKKARR